MGETLLVFQAGGPTAVINATLAGLLEAAPSRFSKVLGLRNSLEFPEISGNPLDLSSLTTSCAAEKRAALSMTPGALLGSSRSTVTEQKLSDLLKLMESYKARHIVGIGGNGTMEALVQLSNFAQLKSVDLQVIGIPKTVDNDLPGVAFAPGYGSAARFVAMAVRDFDCDFRAMQTFDDVTILETMGRNTGWLAAASVLLAGSREDAPHIILTPERAVDEDRLFKRIKDMHQTLGRVFIVTNEMLLTSDGTILGNSVQEGPKDSLGRVMYSLSSGTGNYLAGAIWKRLGLQTRCLRPGNLGRAFSSCVSEIDRDLAIRVGQEAVNSFDSAGNVAKMITVGKDLSLGMQEACLGIGSTPLPERYFNPSDEFSLGSEFYKDTRAIIGNVQPIFVNSDL